MRTVCIGVLIALVPTMFGSASAEPDVYPVWWGGLTFTGHSGTCSSDEFVGGRQEAWLRPAGLEDNGPHAFLSIFKPGYAKGYAKENGNFTSSFQLVKTSQIGTRFGRIAYDVFIRFSSQRPTIIVADTPFINITGQIRGYLGASCVADFRATFVKRVEYDDYE